MSPDLMTTAEVAALCRVSPTTVRWWRHLGRGPRGFTLPQGKRVLYRREDVLSWLASADPDVRPQPAASA